MLKITSGSYSEIEQAFLRQLVSFKKEPFSRIGVVSPSLRLLDRLQKELARQGVAAMNVHFHSFNSLAAEIVNEGKGLPKPVLSDPLFFETLVRTIQKEDRPIRGFEDLAVPEGFPPAVRETLRDLMDSGANADIGEAVKEGFLGKDVDVGWLRELLRLYRIYLKRVDDLPVLPKIAVMKEATRLAPKSKMLGAFDEILFYGFYDLTGVQVDFFHSIVKNHPSRFFFPWIAEHPAYAFANRFRDTFLQPVIEDQEQLDSSDAPPASIRLLNISGLRDEAWVVAGQILEMHEKQNVPYEEIAVIARSRERLARELPFALRERKIPFQTTATQPLINTPFFIELKNNLASAAWPEKASWEEYVGLALAQLKEREVLLADEELKAAARQSLESLAVFKAITATVSKDEFIETLLSRWRGATRPAANAARGVSLLHAEAARGLKFQAVFLIGVEDRIFPRVLKEDPFLRDDARLALNNTLGYKISQKMTALEEERLLFHLFTHSAVESLTMTFQRSDDEGKIVGPSVFLRTFAETTGREFEKWEEPWPRIYSEKLAKADPVSLGYADTTLWYLAKGSSRSAVELAAAMGKDAPAFERGLTAVAQLNKFSDPGAFDGLVGSQVMTSFLSKRTLSPTALERFALCPFQFMGVHVWGLSEIENTQPLEAFDVLIKGQMIHAFLENFYRPWLNQPLPPQFPSDHFENIFLEHIASRPAEVIFLHPLMWSIVTKLLKSDLELFLRKDWENAVASHVTLAAVEEKIATELAAPLDGIRWSGKIDRLERVGKKLRIVDYKTGREPEQDVLKRLQKGQDAQPVLYRLFIEEWLKKTPPPAEEITFVYSYLNNATRELSQTEWQAHRDGLVGAMAELLGHLKKGEFPIRPGRHCASCAIEPICRKNDSVSRFRAQFAGGAGEEE